MKKLTFFGAFLMLFQIAFAGGLLTNTNQSAQFIRMMSRNASTGIDAVYFNPAGLIKMEDGWHFAVYNQTIFQTKTVDSKFPLFSYGAYQVSDDVYEPNDGIYEGVVNVSVFPTAFAVYKEDNWAFSLGFGPNGGGGSAEFDRGLPSFEIPITKVVPGLAGLTQIDPSLDVTGYSADLAFSGSSVFWGIQLGATYQFSDMLSVYGGVRYLPANNSYQGSIQNIQLKVDGGEYPAPAWLLGVSDQLNGYGDMADQGAAKVEPLVEDAGDFKLPELEQAGIITASQRAEIEQGLSMLGSENPSQMTVAEIQNYFENRRDFLYGTSDQLAETAGQLGDKEVDTEQTGAGITPMIGFNFSPDDYWNFAVKYEMKTNLELENNTTVDDLGLFPDGASSRNDLPAILGVGVGYSDESFEAQLSYNMYFNKDVDWGPNTRDIAASHPTIREREIDKNGFEVGLGLQYNFTDEFAFSVGGLYGDMGIADSYQSDFSYSNPSVTTGAGIEWMVANGLTLDAGFSNTFYQDQTVTFNDPDVGPYNETLGKTTMTFALGLSYSLY